MTSRLQAVSFDGAGATAIAGFWARLLERDGARKSLAGALVPGDERQVGLRFVASDTEQVGPRRLHLHLTSKSPADQQRTVETVLRLGGRHIEVGHGIPDGT